jgi:hypothetical protein
VSLHPRTWRRGAGLAAAAVAAAALAPVSAAQAVPTQPIQTVYSDPVPTTAEPIHTGPETDTVTPVTLPAGLTITRTVEAGTATWRLAGNPTGTPDTYQATVIINGTSTDFGVDVAAENATVAYTGKPTIVTTTGEKAKLTAQVTPEPDGTPGDPTQAKVTFTDTATNAVLCQDAPVAADGTTTCEVSATKASYSLALAVGGSYTSPTTPPAPVSVQVAPETTITSGPVDGSIYSSTKATIGYSSSDPAATFVCAMDGKSKPCTAPALKFSNLGKRSHVFTVAAVGADGATDPTPATLSFTVPLDDTSLAPTRTWKRAASSKAYNGTYLKTSTKNSTLTRGVTHATSVSVLVRTEKGAGSLKVFLNGSKVGKIQLAQTGKWRVLPLPGLPADVTGTIKLVTGGKKPVKVDGLAVVKAS